jgi:hypothetical protein
VRRARVVFPEATTEELVIESSFEVDTTPLAATTASVLRTPPAADVLATYHGSGARIDEGVAAFARALDARLRPAHPHLLTPAHALVPARFRVRRRVWTAR